MLQGLPTPVPDLDTEPFWRGCDDGVFLVPTCGSCGAHRWPPGPACPSCHSRETRWVKADGRGRVYSWIVVTHPVHPAIVDHVPYVVAMIELQEGIRIVGNVTGCSPSEVVAGMEVELYFEPPLESGRRLPNFRVDIRHSEPPGSKESIRG
jgi:uncharacterized OB-fold protein